MITVAAKASRKMYSETLRNRRRPTRALDFSSGLLGGVDSDSVMTNQRFAVNRNNNDLSKKKITYQSNRFDQITKNFEQSNRVFVTFFLTMVNLNQ